MCLNLQQDPLNLRDFSQFKVSSRPSRQERPCNLAESPCSWANRPLHIFWVAECPCLPTLPHLPGAAADLSHTLPGVSWFLLLPIPAFHLINSNRPPRAFLLFPWKAPPCPALHRSQPLQASTLPRLLEWVSLQLDTELLLFTASFVAPPGASDTARPMPWAEWQHVAPGTVCRAPRRGVGLQPPLGQGNQMALSCSLPSPIPQCAQQFLVSSLLSTCRTDSGTTSCLRVGSWPSCHVISALRVGQYTRVLCRLQL